MHLKNEIEEVLKNIDFSHGREKAVWEKIAIKLSYDTDNLSLAEFSDISGGLSNFKDMMEERGEN